jgi:hypothetical protein
VAKTYRCEWGHTNPPIREEIKAYATRLVKLAGAVWRPTEDWQFSEIDHVVMNSVGPAKFCAEQVELHGDGDLIKEGDVCSCSVHQTRECGKTLTVVSG